MQTAPLTAAEIRRYLAVLGLERVAPGLAALRRLVRAHLLRIPFETVSKLWYLRRHALRDVPDLDLYLDGIRRHRFGGTCYSNNLHLWRLLRTLGYDATLCAADMPSGPDVHTAITVATGGHKWLVDAGNAAPFLAPLPLDLDCPHELRWGESRWVLRPRDGDGRSSVEVWHCGDLVHGYTLKPGQVPPERFDAVVRDSFRSQATFMNAVLLVRCTPRRLVRILNLEVTHATRARSRTAPLAGRGAFVAAVEREIGIPARITAAAIAGIERFGSVYG
jgi:arylamine N-acetyltransferase